MLSHRCQSKFSSDTSTINFTWRSIWTKIRKFLLHMRWQRRRNFFFFLFNFHFSFYSFFHIFYHKLSHKIALFYCFFGCGQKKKWLMTSTSIFSLKNNSFFSAKINELKWHFEENEFHELIYDSNVSLALLAFTQPRPNASIDIWNAIHSDEKTFNDTWCVGNDQKNC